MSVVIRCDMTRTIPPLFTSKSDDVTADGSVHSFCLPPYIVSDSAVCLRNFLYYNENIVCYKLVSNATIGIFILDAAILRKTAFHILFYKVL